MLTALPVVAPLLTRSRLRVVQGQRAVVVARDLNRCVVERGKHRLGHDPAALHGDDMSAKLRNGGASPRC